MTISSRLVSFQVHGSSSENHPRGLQSNNFQTRQSRPQQIRSPEHGQSHDSFQRRSLFRGRNRSRVHRGLRHSRLFLVSPHQIEPSRSSSLHEVHAGTRWAPVGPMGKVFAELSKIIFSGGWRRRLFDVFIRFWIRSAHRRFSQPISLWIIWLLFVYLFTWGAVYLFGFFFPPRKLSSRRILEKCHVFIDGKKKKVFFFFRPQEAKPVRLKGLHVLYSAKIIDKLMSVAKPFIKSELQKLVRFNFEFRRTFIYFFFAAP